MSNYEDDDYDELDFQIWADSLNNLNDHIKSLKVWNDYAESCQSDYDYLLTLDPRLKKMEKD